MKTYFQLYHATFILSAHSLNYSGPIFTLEELKEEFQDRILFGKDSYKVSEYYTYFRVLETDDEYFDYYRKRHAHWKMYGLALPDSVLQKLYYKNALNLFPSINQSLFKN